VLYSRRVEAQDAVSASVSLVLRPPEAHAAFLGGHSMFLFNFFKHVYIRWTSRDANEKDHEAAARAFVTWANGIPETSYLWEEAAEALYAFNSSSLHGSGADPVVEPDEFIHGWMSGKVYSEDEEESLQ